jgi:hypothetical protein
MYDPARRDAYFAAKETAGAVAWPIGPSKVAGDAAVASLDHLPTKLSALSDILEEAGATDDDVEEVRAAPLFLESRPQRTASMHGYLCPLMRCCCSRADVGLRRSTRNHAVDNAAAVLGCLRWQSCWYSGGRATSGAAGRRFGLGRVPLIHLCLLVGLSLHSLGCTKT